MKSAVSRKSSVISKEIFLCLLSASLLILSYPRFNLWLFAWFGFVPLFFALENKSKFKAFLLSYLTGIIFWLGIIYWLIHVTLPGMLILVLYLALYFGLFGLIIKTYNLQLTTYDLFFIPSIWVLLEYLRSHLFSGFGWALLGYSQYLNLPVIQIADITGVWGISFLVMLVNVVIYSLCAMRSVSCAKKQKFLLPILCILITLSYGYYKISRITQDAKTRAALKVSVIQGNIPQALKWEVKSRDFIIDEYLELCAQVLKDKPDLIIWPEASLPVVLEEEPKFYEKVKDFIKEINTPLLFGAVTSKNNAYFNSAILLSTKGKPQFQYDKLHLVPFGEYIPLKKIFGFLEAVVPIGDFNPGKEYTVFNLPLTNYQLPLKFSVLICFEDLFPELSKNFVKKGADFLVNITNDAWFKKTSSPYQHLQASVFRAVENRVYLVRAANTGVSGFIAPSGKIISLVKDSRGENIFIRGYDTQEIIISQKHLSFYTRYGDIFIVGCFLIVLYGISINLKFKM
jgi:apolipoprotein N-acyltransferase